MDNKNLCSLPQFLVGSNYEEMDRESFLNEAQALKDSGKLTAGSLVELNPNTKLNIVFDIDHTLIFTIDKKLFPRLDLHPDYA